MAYLGAMLLIIDSIDSISNKVYWVAPHLQPPAIVHRIVEAVGQGHLMTAFSCDDNKREAWRSGVPKRVQDLLEKSTFREGCYLALKISEPGEADQLIPITHIDILEAEAVYGMQEQICEFETEAIATAIGDSLDPEKLKEIVVFGVETLSPSLTD